MIYSFQDPTNREITKGIQMTFENGNTISIMFGTGNYCSNRMVASDKSATAEIAIWNANGDEYRFEEGGVKGWCNTNEIAKWIHFSANSTF